MNQEKILKIVKGLGNFELDELLIISELPENNVIKEIETLLKQNIIIKVDSQTYRFLGYQNQKTSQITNKTVKKQRKLFSSPRLTFKGASERFLKYHAQKNCKQITFDCYQSLLKNHLLPAFGSLKLVEITPELIEGFKIQKQDEGVAQKSIKHLLALLGEILALAVFDGAITINPVNSIKMPVIRRAKLRYLNNKEINQILTVAKNSYPEFYPLVYTAIATGLTRSELLGLTWDKVDLKNKVIRVDQSLYKREITPHSIPGKIRNVDMSNSLSEVLFEWKGICPIGKCFFVFPNFKGEAQDANNMIKRKFNPVITKTGVVKIVFNNLRDTYAVRMLQNSYPVEYVHNQMGLSTVAATIDRYKEFL